MESMTVGITPEWHRMARIILEKNISAISGFEISQKIRGAYFEITICSYDEFVTIKIGLSSRYSSTVVVASSLEFMEAVKTLIAVSL